MDAYTYIYSGYTYFLMALTFTTRFRTKNNNGPREFVFFSFQIKAWTKNLKASNGTAKFV